MNKPLYSQKALKAFKFFSLLGVIILCISNTLRITTIGFQNLTKEKYEFFSLILNYICIILFSAVILYPAKIGICCAIAFIDSAIIFIFEPQNNMSIILYFLTIASLYARGFFNKDTKIKNIIVSTLYLGLILTEIRFKDEDLITIFLDKAAYTFVLLLFTFFIKAYLTNQFEAIELHHKLDIKKYPNLTKRDAQWLIDILNRKKYQSIAIDEKLSIGTIKNRLRFIFDELCVGDKQGFINTYSDFEICYGDELTNKPEENPITDNA